MFSRLTRLQGASSVDRASCALGALAGLTYVGAYPTGTVADRRDEGPLPRRLTDPPSRTFAEFSPAPSQDARASHLRLRVSREHGDGAARAEAFEGKCPLRVHGNRPSHFVAAITGGIHFPSMIAATK